MDLWVDALITQAFSILFMFIKNPDKQKRFAGAIRKLKREVDAVVAVLPPEPAPKV